MPDFNAQNAPPLSPRDFAFIVASCDPLVGKYHPDGVGYGFGGWVATLADAAMEAQADLNDVLEAFAARPRHTKGA